MPSPATTSASAVRFQARNVRSLARVNRTSGSAPPGSPGLLSWCSSLLLVAPPPRRRLPGAPMVTGAGGSGAAGTALGGADPPAAAAGATPRARAPPARGHQPHPPHLLHP